MSSPALDFAVFVGGECMARFVHAPDAAHYRQQLIHRIREEAPDLDPVQVAAGVAVVDSPQSPIRRQADGPPVHIWLLWHGGHLLSVHSTPEGAELARASYLKPPSCDADEVTSPVAVTTACIVDQG